MVKKILSIGFEFPGNAAESVPFQSDQSLLDADIVIFEADISLDYYSSEEYKGKPLLSESDSFRLVEDSSHWLSELKTAFDSGKTIIVFLSKLQEVYINTGEKEFSGTGRSQVAKNIVKPYDNYKAIPLDLGKIVPKGGKEIKVVKDLKFLAPYWKEFAPCSEYEVYLEGKIPNPILTTKVGNKVVGAVYSGAKGSMILLPPIDYDRDEFISYDEEEEENVWTPQAVTFGNRLISSIVEIDKALHSSREVTPPPEWTRLDEYRMGNETTLENKMKDIASEIEKLQSTQSSLAMQLHEESGLRRLLYGKGTQLEEAILEALKLMGFEATKYRDTESEFDSIFVSSEGRFLGEAEGKDDGAVNIDKLAQLERNLQEDYAREDVSGYAKGVLFGNAFRLKPLSERQEFFTNKCLAGAQRSGVALVRTTDLFGVAKYIKEHKDASYANKCREILMKTEGKIVEFPPVPIKVKSEKQEDISI